MSTDYALKQCNRRIVEAHQTIRHYVNLKNQLIEKYGTQRLGV